PPSACIGTTKAACPTTSRPSTPARASRSTLPTRRPARPTGTGAPAPTPSNCARPSPPTARPAGRGGTGRAWNGRTVQDTTASGSASSPRRATASLLAADPLAGGRLGLHLRPHLLPPPRVFRAGQIGCVRQGGIRLEAVLGT